MSKEPVVIANSIAALVSAIIVAAVALGYLPWSPEQQAAVMAVVVAAVNVVAGVWARQQSTPLVEPRDVDGEPLIRPNGVPAMKELEATRSEALREMRRETGKAAI